MLGMGRSEGANGRNGEWARGRRGDNDSAALLPAWFGPAPGLIVDVLKSFSASLLQSPSRRFAHSPFCSSALAIGYWLLGLLGL